MHLEMMECRIPFRVTVTLTSDLFFKNYCVPSISLIFFVEGIQDLMCICILGRGSVTYYFWVTVTLTSDLILIIIVSGAYLLYYLR